MKLGKAIAAAVGTAAAVGAAVYAKRRLDETQSPLKKQKSVTAWKSGGEVKHKEIIRNAVSEEKQTEILNDRINTAVRQYEKLSDRNNDEPESKPEITPVSFTFTQSEEDSNIGVSFDRVFDHFNRLEKPGEEERDNESVNIIDTIPATEPENHDTAGKEQEEALHDDEYQAAAIAAVTAMQEEQDGEEKAEDIFEPKQTLLEKGIMTAAPIASAVSELADMPSVIDDNIEEVTAPIDESIFDLSASKPVEDAVKVLEEITEPEQEETENTEDTAEPSLEEQFSAVMSEEVTASEPVEDAVKVLEEIAEPEQKEITENTEDTAEPSLEEQFSAVMSEEVTASEPVEDAVKVLEEITEPEQEETENTEDTAEPSLEEQFSAVMSEEVTASEPVEDAVKVLEEITEPERETEVTENTEDTAEPSLEEQFNAVMSEEVTASEPVEDAVKVLEEITEPEQEEKTIENIVLDDIGDDLSDDISSVRTAESVEDAIKEFGDLIGEPEAAESMLNDNGSYDDDLEQTGDILPQESAVSEKQTLMQSVPSADEEKTRTMDFFDLPDEAYTPVQVAEEKHDDNVAEVEDLFGDLLMDDEPQEKKAFSDPSEVFSMFDTADAAQDDFDKYNDEKIEEENEKKKTSDTRKYIAQDIADNIASFAHLLEPLNAIKENKIRSKSGILFDWEMRIQSLIGDLPIKTYWRNNFRNYEIWTDEKCMEKAGELLSMLELVGIVRDKAKEVVIEKDTLDFYSAQSEHLNNDFHIGETVVVTRPCWKINGRPARKGEIAKKAPFAEFSRKKTSPLETLLRENSCSDGDVNIPVTEENFCTYDRDIPYVKKAIEEGFCKCAVRRMEDGGALAFFYEVIAEGENPHYPPCTLRFEVNIDKNAKVVGRFKSEKV